MPRSSASELHPLIQLVYEDRRYKLDAYQFVGAGLEYAQAIVTDEKSRRTGVKNVEPPAGGQPSGVQGQDTGSKAGSSGLLAAGSGAGAAPRAGGKKKSERQRPAHHVTGQQLCLALKQLAHQDYGYMAKLVLAHWGIRSTSDFGEIVYNLIRIGRLSKSDGDRREDFDNVYDFEQALVHDYKISS
jgi:uncharacterized repeat protein (TIGR04138 family)